MELKIFLTNDFIKCVYSFWWTLGKLFGLFPFYYDKKQRKYCQSMSSQVYSTLVGIIVTSSYPYVFFKFFKAIDVVDNPTQISIIVSQIADLFMFPFMILVYFLQIYNNRELVNLYNDLAKCSEDFETRFPSNTQPKNIYGFTLCASILIKVLKNVYQTLAVFFITRDFEFKYPILFIDKFSNYVSTIISVQFYLGVLFIWCYMGKVQIVLKSLRINQINLAKITPEEREEFISLDLCEKFTEIALGYNRIFDLFRRHESFYYFQVLFLLGQIFLTLIHQIFLEFMWLIYLITKEKRVFGYIMLLGALNIFCIIIELTLYLKVSLKITEKVQDFHRFPFKLCKCIFIFSRPLLSKNSSQTLYGRTIFVFSEVYVEFTS